MQIDRVELGEGYPGSLFFKCKFPAATNNIVNSVHGGALSTYVDIATTIAIMAFDEKQRTNVSAKLDMEFMSAAKIEQEVEIEAKVNKIGKMLAFSEGRITDLKTK